MSMAWVDDRKAYDMVPHSRIIECLDLLKIADNIRGFIIESMKGWQTNLISSGEILGNVKIRRGTFQGDNLSPLLFVICMIPLALVLRELNK